MTTELIKVGGKSITVGRYALVVKGVRLRLKSRVSLNEMEQSPGTIIDLSDNSIPDDTREYIGQLISNRVMPSFATQKEAEAARETGTKAGVIEVDEPARKRRKSSRTAKPDADATADTDPDGPADEGAE